ncbi:MAG TPA: serine/threonine-protein kinase [Pirellulaceae bacterium]|nr:serine/threonine-protein kinase [Pirellulaceae bacterium]HMO92090.1 serine/threonine-protein kinase [Pirellulaceae bacterium]HMP69322.1 serine/threonine-protein kinase [Pirellulaceae bacterium]
MSLFDKLKGIFTGGSASKRLDVSSRFKFERHAFTGTMSKFRVAREIKTGKLFGIKFLDQEKLEVFRARFKGLNKPEEGEIAMQMEHPYIVKTYEYGLTTSGEEYILMEYIDGPGLNTLISERSQKLDGHQLEFIRQMAEAIQALHDAGFIHRDICPRNFIVNRDMKWLKLIDFGLTVPNTPPFRLPGNRTGTPQYMAPEIVRRRDTDHTVDIFAFGVSAYRLLTFEHPWGSTETSGLAALAHDSKAHQPIEIHRPDIDPVLANAIHKCLKAKPENRMQSAKLFLHAIRDVESAFVPSRT